VLMLTLRFRRNGLIAPILDWFYRADVAEETVAIRQTAVEAETIETETKGATND